ncbi:MAG: exosortase/archaeosortase family protein [Prolixibacteraceae bacterium]|nr:exosortase/archaeosortase family protein [Prolixibacteraceae bacterium]
MFIVWRVFRKWMILHGQYTDFTQLASTLYLKTGLAFLKLFKHDVSVNYAERKMWLTGSDQAVEVVYDCLGVNLFFVFLIFLLAYPGSLRTKAWFIPLGFFIIFLLNSMRMAALTIVVECCYQQLDFLHHFVFQGFIYLAIFGLWFWFSNLKK